MLVLIFLTQQYYIDNYSLTLVDVHLAHVIYNSTHDVLFIYLLISIFKTWNWWFVRNNYNNECMRINDAKLER